MDDYRVRVVLKSSGEDYVIKTEARKITFGKNVMRRDTIYIFDFDEVRIEMGENLVEEIWEILLYMLRRDFVLKALETFFRL